MKSRFVRLAEKDRSTVSIRIDGRLVEALAGDTLMVAILTHARTLRRGEFEGEARAGFCLMGACQDCWVWTEDGERLRSCSTEVKHGMSIRTSPPETYWPRTPDLSAHLQASGPESP